MASILKVDEMQGVTSAGDITITGEGGSATMQLQQGLCKAWHKATDSATINESFNISSASDQGTGNYDYSFTNNMSNTDYSLTCSGSYAEIAEPEQGNTTASQYTVRTFGRQDSLTNADQRQSAQIAGDLA